jgi:hypothetical protein
MGMASERTVIWAWMLGGLLGRMLGMCVQIVDVRVMSVQ